MLIVHYLFSRLRLIQTYCEATNHESRSKTIRIRPKPIHPLVKFSSKLPTASEDKTFVDNLEPIGFKSHRESYCVNSVLLLKSDESMLYTLILFGFCYIVCF